jgi:hypothetical protein
MQHDFLIRVLIAIEKKNSLWSKEFPKSPNRKSSFSKVISVPNSGERFFQNNNILLAFKYMLHLCNLYNFIQSNLLVSCFLRPFPNFVNK